MLLELYPRVHRRYTSVPIIGPALDGYGTWHLKQGYSTDRAREYFRAAPGAPVTATRCAEPERPHPCSAAGLCADGFASGS